MNSHRCLFATGSDKGYILCSATLPALLGKTKVRRCELDLWNFETSQQRIELLNCYKKELVCLNIVEMRCDVGKGNDRLGGECVSEFEDIQSRQFLGAQPDPIR